MTTHQVFKGFVWLYSLQLVAWIGFMALAIYTTTYYELLQAGLADNDSQLQYQISYFFHPGGTVIGLVLALFVVIPQLWMSLRGLRSASESEANETATSLSGFIRAINRVALPLGLLYLCTAGVLSVGTELIGITASAPVLAGVVIALIAASLRDRFDVPEPAAKVKARTSWFDDVPKETDFAFHNFSADAAATPPAPVAPSRPLTEAEQVASRSLSIALGSYGTLAVSLLSLLSAFGNYAPGGIGVVADFGFVIFHFVVMLPIAIYLVFKSVELLERGGKKYVLLPAVAAAIASIFIVPIA